MFSSDQIDYIKNRGSQLVIIEQQVENFKSGFPFLSIERPATIGDGIIQLTSSQIDKYKKQYGGQTVNSKLLKFVPASGAATRMFKELFEYLDSGEINEGVNKFIAGLRDFAFFDELALALKSHGQDMEVLVQQKSFKPIVEALLSENGLNYGNLPKGLLSFHASADGSRTPLEEHLVEGAKYAKQEDGTVNLHFTVSPEHQKKFELRLAQMIGKFEREFGVSYNVSFSQQKKSTDTIAVDLSNEPFEDEGQLLFRPAGHGALLENLNDLEADIIFVKNIDNVVPDHLKEDTILYKKALASLLIEFQQDSFDWQKRIEAGEDCLAEAVATLSSKYSFKAKLQNIEALSKFLNRPIRVCGMVVNTGEPGGGPFWADNDGGLSLQIAETAQIDLSDEQQSIILQKSSHFNPVDLVCGVKNFKGVKFDLLKFRNDKTGFITQKSKSGRDLKAMELPGLWNGAMADWITLFVEVPITTFNPVKTVNDLLKPSHQ